VTRFVGIEFPSEVVFDEVHFGKFASFYITGEYYFDLHPALGKMILALFGYLAGFDGEFKFNEIGDDYIANKVPYTAMRAVSSISGFFTILLSYLILREVKVGPVGALLACSLIIFDNSLMLISRLILLDGLLLFFIVLSAYSWIRFYKLRKVPFSHSWWSWLTITGVAIGCTVSIKMVGLFTIALIGLATIMDLWRLLDIKAGLSIDKFLNHFYARALCLIVIPVVIYLGSFYVHFALLTQSGPGNDFMSPDFQSILIGSSMNEAPHCKVL
jgi:dolichyl-phosphate-mannose-protein mannosyltransferase